MLKDTLDKFYCEYDFKERLLHDPIELPHRYKKREDIEAAGFIASCLAYGRVDLFKPVIERILSVMGKSPYLFLMDFDVKKHSKLFPFKYRFNDSLDIVCLLYIIHKLLLKHSSIEKAFLKYYKPEEQNIESGLAGLVRESLSVDTSPVYGRSLHPAGLLQFLPSPEKGSACKRMNLFLRWMVRDRDIDFGIWKKIQKNKLIIPLDTHIARVSKCLGFTKRTASDWKSAVEITEALKRFDMEDPLKYDFALCHHGISGICNPANKAACRACVFSGALCYTIEMICEAKTNRHSDNRDKYRNIFNNAAVSLWEEDLSGVKAAIDSLKNSGVTDFRNYFEEHPDFVQRAVQLITIVDVNDASVKLYEAKTKKELMDSLDRVITAQSYDTFREELLAIAEGKKYFEAESVNMTLRGRKMNILIRLTIPAEDSEFRNMLVSIFDITDYKTMEGMLLRAKEFEALGLFAGGLVHDFNNLLAVILSNVELAEMSLPPEDALHKRLAAAKKASMRAIELTEQLLVFSGGKALEKDIAPIAGIIKEAANLVMKGSDNRCNFIIADDLWPVAYDEEQLSRVIRNIVTNAGEAMPGGGTLKISAENVRLESGNNLSLKEGAYVKVSFEDDGIGIDEKHLVNVFDPYFTTKGMGREKGRGLGLAVCYSILQKHEGTITVDSEHGVGTTFSIYLPAVA